MKTNQTESLPVAAHTPGPWIAIASKADPGSWQIQKQISADKVYPSWAVALIPNYQNCDAANARLIAAAPELLNALQWSWGIMNDYWHANTTEEKNYYAQDMQHALDTMHKALAKAKGGQ